MLIRRYWLLSSVDTVLKLINLYISYKNVLLIRTGALDHLTSSRLQIRTAEKHFSLFNDGSSRNKHRLLQYVCKKKTQKKKPAVCFSAIQDDFWCEVFVFCSLSSSWPQLSSRNILITITSLSGLTLQTPAAKG